MYGLASAPVSDEICEAGSGANVVFNTVYPESDWATCTSVPRFVGMYVMIHRWHGRIQEINDKYECDTADGGKHNYEHRINRPYDSDIYAKDEGENYHDNYLFNWSDKGAATEIFFEYETQGRDSAAGVDVRV